MSDWTIRSYHPDDASRTEAMLRRSWADAYSWLDPAEFEALHGLLADGIRPLVPGRDEKAFVAEENGEVLGLAVVGEHGATAFLWGMYVEPARQREGIGSRLIQTAIAAVTTASVIEIRVLEGEPPVVRFYQRHGFRTVGEVDDDILPGRPRRFTVMSLARP
ncbi:MAG: GNAT family N-acetyltransferase [Bauldia sp.]